MQPGTTQPSDPLPSQAKGAGWLDGVSRGVVCYYLTSVVAVAAVSFGADFVRPARHLLAERGDVWDAFANWDGRWYKKIVEQGYRYESDRPASIAFFPAYPGAAWVVAAATGMRTEWALLLVSHVALLGFFVVWGAYVGGRAGPSADGEKGREGEWERGGWGEREQMWVLVATGTFPVTMWWRMAYSESLFLFTAALAFLAMQRRWHGVWIALIIGLCTATRPVGVCLLLPFGMHVLQASRKGAKAQGEETARGRFATLRLGARLVCLLALACWGILAYMVYLGWEFGEPLAFAKTQAFWRVRPMVPAAEKIQALATLEPIWSVFVPSSPAYWARHEGDIGFLFSLQLFNPIYFVGAVVVLLIGIWRRPSSRRPSTEYSVLGAAHAAAVPSPASDSPQPSKGARESLLDGKEAVFCAALLLIPYLTRSHEMCMEGMGRFVGAIFPLYIVLGRFYAALPAPLAALLVGLSCFMLGSYAALFAAWHRFF
jgi:hypothetical protein